MKEKNYYPIKKAISLDDLIYEFEKIKDGTIGVLDVPLAIYSLAIEIRELKKDLISKPSTLE